jgi:3-hydroxyisobutyrate dehydrogenase-like beta-hydroxyacid dehydrogenase
MGGFASSRILEIHGARMIKRTFDPGFRIELLLIPGEVARESGMMSPTIPI